MFEVERNEKINTNIGILVKERPSIPTGKRRKITYEIAGRDGLLFEHDGTVEDIEITVTFTFKEKPEKWMERFRKAKSWLLSESNNVLRFSDCPDCFYKVKHTEIADGERVVKELGEFSVIFTCEGYQYLNDGTMEIKINKRKMLCNPYAVSHPIYKIEGDGNFKLEVNEKKLEGNVNRVLFIDTERMIAYSENGMKNTSVKGNYDELYLQPGENYITITPDCKLCVIPNWRCF